MKKILGLGLVALLVMAMVGGGTWAYFNDTETSGGNILTAGTLDLGLANTSGAETGGSVNATWTSPAGWKPGDTVDYTLYLNNSGSINMSSVSVNFSQVLTGSKPATVSAGPGGDTDNITKMIYASIATLNGTALPFQGDTLYTLTQNGTMNMTSLASNSEALLRIVWTFNASATNGCQNNTENITLTLIGQQ